MTHQEKAAKEYVASITADWHDVPFTTKDLIRAYMAGFNQGFGDAMEGGWKRGES